MDDTQYISFVPKGIPNIISIYDELKNKTTADKIILSMTPYSDIYEKLKNTYDNDMKSISILSKKIDNYKEACSNLEDLQSKANYFISKLKSSLADDLVYELEVCINIIKQIETSDSEIKLTTMATSIFKYLYNKPEQK